MGTGELIILWRLLMLCLFTHDVIVHSLMVIMVMSVCCCVARESFKLISYSIIDKTHELEMGDAFRNVLQRVATTEEPQLSL